MNSLAIQYPNDQIKEKILLFFKNFLNDEAKIIENISYTYKNDIGETIKVENGKEVVVPTKDELLELEEISKDRKKDDFVSFDKIDWEQMYSIKFHKQVQKFIQSRTKQEKLRFKDKFQKLSENPFSTNQELDIKKMEGSNFYRLRIRTYRFIFSIENSELMVFIEKAGNRGDIYKQYSPKKGKRGVQRTKG